MNSKRGGCFFWAWKDDPMCQRSKMIIPGLFRRINANEVAMGSRSSKKFKKRKSVVLG
ncbi:hypothetical protein ACS0TY_023314 [Phlomoides rotata]